MTRLFCIALWATLAIGPAAVAQQAAAPAREMPPIDGGRAGTRAMAPRSFTSTIQGTALSSTNGQLADTVVRLRDARTGRILATQLTDKSGLFAFRSLDPGSYIVEIMSQDQTAVLAASQILNMDAGNVASAIVKLPFRLSPFAGILGTGTTPASAAAVMTQAAANSVLLVATPATAAPTCQTQVF